MSNEKKNLINEEELDKVTGGSAAFSADASNLSALSALASADTCGKKLASVDETQANFSAPRGKAL